MRGVRDELKKFLLRLIQTEVPELRRSNLFVAPTQRQSI